MKLEEQIEKLSEIGLVLNEGVSIDDLLISFSRDEYESTPFDLILFVYGIEIEEEPWGRFICDKAWNFDVEAIEDNGSYINIVKQFHRISGRSKCIERLADLVDVEKSHAELHYEIDGVERKFEPVVDNDWADAGVVEAIMNDLKEPGYDFYPKGNGQASIWFYLSERQALELNKIANNVFGLNRKPWWKVW